MSSRVAISEIEIGESVIGMPIWPSAVRMRFATGSSTVERSAVKYSVRPDLNLSRPLPSGYPALTISAFALAMFVEYVLTGTYEL